MNNIITNMYLIQEAVFSAGSETLGLIMCADFSMK